MQSAADIIKLMDKATTGTPSEGQYRAAKEVHDQFVLVTMVAILGNLERIATALESK